MQHRHKQQGMILGVLAMLFAIGVATALTSEFARNNAALKRDRISDEALAKAREALIGYATGRPVDNVVGPGYLPCPDLDDDGWAESTCGSQLGDIGQAERLGRLPWKTLGVGDLRDGYGERLWYAVSSKYKGLLNCTLTPDCLDMSPDAALGTITVRDPGGEIVHDGRSANLHSPGSGGAAAVVIAPGPALSRGTVPQDRSCTGGECNSAGHCISKPWSLTPKCNPVNYLDRATINGIDEDNASFADRNDAAGRRLNGDGFVRGPVRAASGAVLVNDRVAVIGYDDIVPGIMLRVAQEVALCLREYASQPQNRGRYPWPAPTCRQGNADAAIAWSDGANVLFGRVPDSAVPRDARKQCGRNERELGGCLLHRRQSRAGLVAGVEAPCFLRHRRGPSAAGGRRPAMWRRSKLPANAGWRGSRLRDGKGIRGAGCRRADGHRARSRNPMALPRWSKCATGSKARTPSCRDESESRIQRLRTRRVARFLRAAFVLQPPHRGAGPRVERCRAGLALRP